MRTTNICLPLCVLLIASACGSPTSPSPVVVGAWDLSFSVFDQRACTSAPGPTPGCAGAGRLDFRATRPLDAVHSYRASCQSCGGAAEYGVFDQPLSSAQLRGDMLEFTLAACRFTAALPDMRAETVAGVVVCRPDAREAEVRGNWTMSRR